MKIVLFCHSLISDWNHGNAHFLRGVCSELRRRGHDVTVYEPADAWSLQNLLRHESPRHLPGLLAELRSHYPHLDPVRYDPEDLDLDRALDGADLVLVHEWNDPSLVRRLGRHRRRTSGYRLLFHDTHHRSVTDPGALARYELDDYDGILAFGDAVCEVYRERGWGRRVWTWHEAADVRVFRPLERSPAGDVVWIGNWGDEERTREIHEFILDPVAELGLDAAVHGVRYPPEALAAVERAGGEYRGWIANYRVPEALARFRATVHVPRRPYLEELRSTPTIRPFEALACGIPMVSARWDDPADLFRAGQDFLVARDPEEMKDHLAALEHDEDLRTSLARNGRETVLERHTCGHRVEELLDIHAGLEGDLPRLTGEGASTDAAPVRSGGSRQDSEAQIPALDDPLYDATEKP